MKVFSKEKYLADMGQEKYDYFKRIVEKCDGKTAEEMREMGYFVLEGWTIEKGETK